MSSSEKTRLTRNSYYRTLGSGLLAGYSGVRLADSVRVKPYYQIVDKPHYI